MPTATSPRDTDRGTTPPVEAVAVAVALVIVALARLLQAAARGLARAGGPRAVARVEAAELPTPRYATYTVEKVEATLRELEEHFSMTSEHFLHLREQDKLPTEMSRHTANVWAALWHEKTRLRSAERDAPLKAVAAF